MAAAGIEAINVFGGTAYLDVMQLAEYRNLDPARFENLLMKEKRWRFRTKTPSHSALTRQSRLSTD